MGQEEDDEEEEIGAADKDEQMCSAACLGRLSPARALAAADAQVCTAVVASGHFFCFK